MAVVATLITTFICIFLLFLFIKLFDLIWWTPARLKSIMGAQGIKGPPYKLVFGNSKEIIKMIFEDPHNLSEGFSHDIVPRFQPHIYSWQKIYGRTFMFWLGPKPAVVITDPEMMKAVLTNNDETFTKSETSDFARKILGNGLVTSGGEQWKKVRKHVNPFFHAESLKGMHPAMVASTVAMLERWKGHEGNEIEVFEEFTRLTLEIISRTAFGMNYMDGYDMHVSLAKLTKLVIRNFFTIRIPFISKIFKDKDQIEAEKLEKQLADCVISMVSNRTKMAMTGELENYGNDFLGLLVRANQSGDANKKISMDDLIDECKTIYAAGSETSNSHMAWTILLLAIHTDWQDEARKEVFGLFGQQNPTMDGITRLKTLNMIIQESLRLYPPITETMRKVAREIKVGKFTFPANLNLYFPILAVHHDPSIWGKDAHLFKPERFSEGVAKATNNNIAAFLPFSLGPRTCVGNNFANNETKIVLSMILQRYKFTISPNYVHSPHVQITIQPQHGVKIILHEVKSSEY